MAISSFRLGGESADKGLIAGRSGDSPVSSLERRSTHFSDPCVRTNRRTVKHRQVKRQLYAHALANLTIPTVGFVMALAVAWKTGIGLMEIVLLGVLFFLTAGAISVAYHRHLTHKSFKAHPAVRAVIIVLGCMAAQGPPIYWTAVHRYHHAHSDEPGDSHSPYRFGKGGWNLL